LKNEIESRIVHEKEKPFRKKTSNDHKQPVACQCWQMRNPTGKKKEKLISVKKSTASKDKKDSDTSKVENVLPPELQFQHPAIKSDYASGSKDSAKKTAANEPQPRKNYFKDQKSYQERTFKQPTSVDSQDGTSAENPIKDFPIKDYPIKDFPIKDFPIKDFPIKDFPIKDMVAIEKPVLEEPAKIMDITESNLAAVAGQEDIEKNTLMKNNHLQIIDHKQKSGS
jgi:hypothetical protein